LDANALGNEEALIGLTVCYKSGLRFDADYYRSKHIPLTAEKLGSHGLKSTEVRKILGTPMGTLAPYQVITTLYFGDTAALEGALKSAEGQAVVADIANFYDGMPDLMISEIVD
jgi:uncharacterized protein (TIGR02118 family)